MESYQKERDVITRVIGGETIVVPIKKAVVNLGSIYTMNKVATRIWNLLDTSPTVTEIVQTITTEFQVSPEEAMRDVNEFLEQLKEARLIVYKEAGAASI